jgi:hypothetical protein
MRQSVFTVALLVLALFSYAQVTIQAPYPAAGLVQLNQLWNLTLVNGTTTPIDGRVEMVLKDRESGIELLTATSSMFTIPKGSVSLNINKLSPVQYNWLAMDPSGALNSLLPSGNYIVCYSFTRILAEKQDQLAEECASFDVERLSPPMLIFPGDSALLDAYPGQFTWTPPAPAGMTRHLHYEIIITEIKEGQKADEAIQSNVSFYNEGHVVNNFMTYPAALPAFEKEKWYAWQIVARDDKNYAGKSEVWVFTVKKKNPLDMIIKGTPYIRMKTDMQETGIAPNGFLKLSYFNRSNDSTATIFISDLSSGNEKKPRSVTIRIIPGENQIMINIKKLISFSEQSTYKAEIISSLGERNSILFRVKNFDEK